MKITCLAENTSFDEALNCEHGLSLLIEANEKTILFDMGQSELFSINAEKMGIDLSRVDVAILSHGHYDHGGGLKRFLEINASAPILINEYAFEPHYNSTGKYIGLDTSLANEKRIIFTDDIYTVGTGLTLFSKIDGPSYGKGTDGMTAERDGTIVPDDFRHEQYLLIEENGKRVLISGCSHKGIENITAFTLPDVLVGGFHFSKLPLDGELEARARGLNAFGAEYYTCHCTGKEQYEFMKKHVDRLSYLATGDVITL